MYEMFASILQWIYSWLGNYGWSVVVFTFLIRIIILPFDYKSRVAMRKTQKIQPQLNKLQQKYANDKDKLNLKMSELYKKEKINPLSSCLPMLLSMPILFCMFGAMRIVANQQIVIQVLDMLQGRAPEMESWYWIKNIWMPDSPFASMLPSLSMMQQVTDANIWTTYFTPEVIAALPAELGLTVESFTSANLQTTISTISAYLQTTSWYANSGALSGWTFNLWITTISVMKDWNGLFILPVLSAGSQFIMTKLQPSQPVQTDAQGNKIQNQQTAGTGAFMTWFFPLFSLWICANYNGMFALYWVASNLVAMLETVGINKYLDAKDKKAMTAEGTVK